MGFNDELQRPVNISPASVIVTPGQTALEALSEDEPQPDIPLDPLSRLGALVLLKWDTASMRRRRLEDIWYHALCNDEGFYLRFQSSDVEDSQFFYKMTRQYNVEAEGAIQKFLLPNAERIWDLEPSAKPWAPWLNLKNPADPEANNRALDLMTQQIQDDLDTMNFDELCREVSGSLPRYGSAIVFGPVRHPNPRKRFINLSALQGADQVGDQDPDAPRLDAATDFLATAQKSAAADGWAVVTDPADERRPFYNFESIWNFYPDPDAEKVQKMNYFFLRDHETKTYMAGLLEDPTFFKDAISTLLELRPTGAYDPMWWEHATLTQGDRERYTLLRFYGFLYKKDFEDSDLDPDEYKADDKGAVYEIWMCDRRVIKCKKREFRPDRLPIKVIPMDKRDGSPLGRGIGEKLFDIQDMLNSLARACHDDIRHSMGANAMVDMNAVVAGTDLSIRGRKVWPVRRTELTGGGTSKPVEYFLVPTQQDHYMASIEKWRRIAPEICGLPKTLMPEQMGSGMRTDEMLQAIFEQAETFIKVVMGNIDQHWIEPTIGEIYEWNMQYNGTPGIHGDFKPVAKGVRGAIEREVVGKRSMAFFQTMQQAGMPDVIDEWTLLRAVMRGIGLDGKQAVLTTEGYIAKLQARAKQKAMDTAAGRDEKEAGERRESSIRDVLLQDTKTTPDTNPTWVGKTEALYKSMGLMNGRLAAGLAIWAKKLALDYERAGAANPQESQALTAGLDNTGGLAGQNAQMPQAVQPGAEDQVPGGQPMPENIPTAQPGPGDIAQIPGAQ